MSVRFFGTDAAQKTSRMSLGAFKQLGRYAESYLVTHFNRLSIQKNESGFVRVNIPLTSEIEDQFQDISKLRLNFWAPETGVKISEESIHNHPAYFESWIIKGGYVHELFEEAERNEPNSETYQCYRILKQSGSKSFSFIGPARLSQGVKQEEKEGNIVVISKDVIHKVIETYHKTLTLNVVWKDEEETCYDIFLTKNASVEEVKTERELVSRRKSKVILGEMLSYLSNKVQE